MNKNEIAEQTKLAFEFIQKLYFEVSYLIKEIEGLLAEEDPQFILCRPGGYQVTTRGSTGLEPNFVYHWLTRKMAVAFSPADMTPTARGITVTKLEPDTKVIYVRIILDDRDIAEPQIYSGILYNFHKKSPPTKWPTKFEQLMTTMEYNESKAFAKPDAINYEDGNVRFMGQLFRVPLYDINSSEEIQARIIQPTLELYSEI